MKSIGQDVESVYFQLLNDTHRKAFYLDDVGLVPGSPSSVLKRQVGCARNIDNPYHRDYPCGACEVCMEKGVVRKLLKLSQRMLDPEIHEYVFFTLSLPKWPFGLPVVDGCKNLGELLYWTPPLIAEPCREGLGMQDILGGLKAVGFRVVESCFPDSVLGVVLFLHLADDYLQFSPHLHGVVCATALAKDCWPLKRDSRGGFPDMARAWRRALLRGGVSAREFQKMLHERWAEGLGRFFEEKLKKCSERSVPGVETKNVGYRFLNAHGHLANGIGDVIRDAVLADSKCVDARRMSRNVVTDEEDPAAAFRGVLGYGLDGHMKSTEIRSQGGWMYTVGFWLNGKWRSCGKHDVLCRRLVQLAYAGKGVKRYQAKGLFAAALGGRGRAYGDAFIAAMNRGYPRAC